MGVFNWDNSLSVGIESIDSQHRKMIDMINNFYDEIHRIHEGESNSTLNELRSALINDMVVYAREHFRTEEEYFLKFGYSDFDIHKKEHDEFTSKVTDLKKRYDEGKLILSTEITDFLKEWVISHIKENDQKYSVFLKGKGVM
jgi:hemerythrin